MTRHRRYRMRRKTRLRLRAPAGTLFLLACLLSLWLIDRKKHFYHYL